MRTLSLGGRSPLQAATFFTGLVVAVAFGVLTGHSPIIGLAGAAALVYVFVVMRDLTFGLCLFLLVTFLDAVSRNHNLSLTKGAGAVLALSWLTTLASRRDADRTLSSQAPWLTVAVLAFLIWSGMSTFWAQSSGAALRSTFRFGLDALLVPIAFYAVRERKHVVWLLAVFVAGTLLSVAWGITQGKVAGGAAAQQIGRLAGANVEANVLAELLVGAIVLSSALALVLRRAPLARALAAFAAVAAIAAFFGTFSRGGVIALGIALLAGCIFAGTLRPVFVVLVLGVVIVGAVFIGNTTSGAVNRLTSTSTSGRSDIWKVGMRMVDAHPIAGVGSGNYEVAEPNYILDATGPIRAGDFIVNNPYPAHNIYLHVLAEMGVIGLTLFLSVIALSLGAVVRAVHLFRRRGDRMMEMLGRALVIALLGMLAADFFVSDQYSKQLWLLLGLGPALLALARSTPAETATAARAAMPGWLARPRSGWRG